MTLIVLGIDPGIRGGLAVVSNNGVGSLIDAIDIPTVGDGAKERVDVIAVREWIERHKPDLALIERAQAMPRQGASSGFKYGRATGSLEAAGSYARFRSRSSSRPPGNVSGNCHRRTRNAAASARSSCFRAHIACSLASSITGTPKQH
jgi:Crossover junction endodeoxyribonuclease RuvC